jgi:hypothetical protein
MTQPQQAQSQSGAGDIIICAQGVVRPHKNPDIFHIQAMLTPQLAKRRVGAGYPSYLKLDVNLSMIPPEVMSWIREQPEGTSMADTPTLYFRLFVLGGRHVVAKFAGSAEDNVFLLASVGGNDPGTGTPADDEAEDAPPATADEDDDIIEENDDAGDTDADDAEPVKP